MRRDLLQRSKKTYGVSRMKRTRRFCTDARAADLPNTFPFNPQQLSTAEARNIGRAGFAFESAPSQVKLRLGADERSDPQGFLGTSGALDCPFAKPVTCDPCARYRNITGMCNNLVSPRFGSANTPFERSLPPVYNDGLSSPRSRSVLFGKLPLPRLISTTVHGASNATTLDRDFTNIAMEFGQFVSHDTERTAPSQESDGSELICCEGPLTLRLRRQDCLPIEIPEGDPFFRQFQRRCMEFARALSSPPLNCRLGPRQQLNQETAYLDGSAIYWNSEKLAKEHRVRRNGAYAMNRTVTKTILVNLNFVAKNLHPPNHVDDIDLWTGAVSEKVIKGAVVGPTIACIVGRQFFLLKKRDRFFYEHNDIYAKFSLNQLKQIRKTSFARIIYDNTDAKSLQKNVFRVEKNKKNPKVKHNKIPSVNLRGWKE